MKCFFIPNKLVLKKLRRKMENSRRCEICIVDFHRASMQKHLRSKKHLGKEKQSEMIILKRILKREQKPINKENVYNAKTLKKQ